MLKHDPNLKKKKKVQMDQAKDKLRKERQAAKRRAEPIIIPVDPDSVPGTALKFIAPSIPKLAFIFDETC